MLTILSTLGFGTLLGSVLTLWGKAVLDRRAEIRAERRSLYVDLVRVLSSRRDYMRNAIFDQEMKEPDVPNDQVDALNARLLIDASKEVRQRSDVCLELLTRFRNSRSFGAPVEVDEHGFYRYRFEQTRSQPEEMRHMVMRVSLGRISDDFAAALDRLVEQVRVELHGQGQKAQRGKGNK